MSKGKFTKGKWNLHVREMTDTNGETFRKCFIENGGTALAQFANFGEEDEANARLCSAAPEMYRILEQIDRWNLFGFDSTMSKRIEKAVRKANGERQQKEN